VSETRVNFDGVTPDITTSTAPSVSATPGGGAVDNPPAAAASSAGGGKTPDNPFLSQM